MYTCIYNIRNHVNWHKKLPSGIQTHFHHKSSPPLYKTYSNLRFRSICVHFNSSYVVLSRVKRKYEDCKVLQHPTIDWHPPTPASCSLSLSTVVTWLFLVVTSLRTKAPFSYIFISDSVFRQIDFTEKFYVCLGDVFVYWKVIGYIKFSISLNREN